MNDSILFPDLIAQAQQRSALQPNPQFRARISIIMNIQAQLLKKKANINVNNRLKETLLGLMQVQMPISVHQ